MILLPHKELDAAAELLLPKERGLFLHYIFEAPENLPDYLKGFPGFLHAYGRQILLKWSGDNSEVYAPYADAPSVAKFYDTIMQPIKDFSEPWWHGRHVLILNHRQRLLKRDPNYAEVFSNVYIVPQVRAPVLSPGLVPDTWYLDGSKFPMGHVSTEELTRQGIIPKMAPNWKKLLLDTEA